MHGAGNYGSTGVTEDKWSAGELVREGHGVLKAVENQLLAIWRQHQDQTNQTLGYYSVIGGFSMVLVSVLGLVLRSGLFRSVVQVYLGIFGAVILCLEMETGYFNKHQEFKEFIKVYFHFVCTFNGRAAFYISLAVLLLAQWPFVPDLVIGSYMLFVSFRYIAAGRSSAAKLKLLKGKFAGEKDAVALFDSYADQQTSLLMKTGFQHLMEAQLDEDESKMNSQQLSAAMMQMAGETKEEVNEAEFKQFFFPSEERSPPENPGVTAVESATGLPSHGL